MGRQVMMALPHRMTVSCSTLQDEMSEVHTVPSQTPERMSKAHPLIWTLYYFSMVLSRNQLAGSAFSMLPRSGLQPQGI